MNFHQPHLCHFNISHFHENSWSFMNFHEIPWIIGAFFHHTSWTFMKIHELFQLGNIKLDVLFIFCEHVFLIVQQRCRLLVTRLHYMSHVILNNFMTESRNTCCSDNQVMTSRKCVTYNHFTATTGGLNDDSILTSSHLHSTVHTFAWRNVHTSHRFVMGLF